MSAITPEPLSRTYNRRNTDDLLSLLTDAARHYGRLLQAEEIAAAASVLQGRIGGRTRATGANDATDPSHALRQQIEAAGGFLAIPLGQARHALTGSIRPKAADGAPVNSHQSRASAGQVLDELGLDMFPSRHITGTHLPVVIHEAGLPVAGLLAALAVGDAIEADRLTEEIRTAAGQVVLTA
ncbi:hypothetical protein [Streptomyces prunicolor]|uniref:hypothetical protein n=1 Tax=Streptomyces prunicolor TaxID=67348 RepID=UPI003441C9E3